MPCWELFERQSAAYQTSVLPPECTARVAVELASDFGWSRWVGEHGATVCMTGFGASAPLADLLKKFGFTVENVVQPRARSRVVERDHVMNRSASALRRRCLAPFAGTPAIGAWHRRLPLPV